MATISTERHIWAPTDEAWQALADWGALHERLARGFVTDVQLDGEDRLVTFFNGATVRERLVSSDAEEQRLVWSIVDGPYSHHNGAAQIFSHPEGGTRFIWTADLLPDELAGPTQEMMERGIDAVKATLEEASETQ